MCSSGTTGLPKAVKISHTHFIYKASMFACPMNTVLFCFSSIFWYTGMCCLLVGCLATIKRVITANPFTPLYGLQVMDKYKVSFIFAAPIHISLMAQHPSASTMDLSAVNAFFTGGAFVSEPLKASMNKYLPQGKVMNCYALTEVGGVVTVPGKYDRVGSCGPLVDGMQVKVVDDTTNSLGPGQQGEFYVRTLYSFLGYHKNEAATDETMDSDGWIHTGDIGYMDEDGYLFMVDRKKDIFKYAGYHVSPKIERGGITF
jgi:4-coumarate--CoA ligase